MYRVILLLLTPLLLASYSNAWWIDYEYEPRSKPIGAIASSKYDKELLAVEIFTCENNRYFTETQCLEIGENNGAFIVSGDFNKDGVSELWSTGIVKFRSSDYPFANVAILSNPDTGEILQILKVKRNKPGFAVFFEFEGRLLLSFCMECGNYVSVEWKNEGWALVWPEPYG